MLSKKVHVLVFLSIIELKSARWNNEILTLFSKSYHGEEFLDPVQIATLLWLVVSAFSLRQICQL